MANKAILAGGSGFIGQALAKKLQAEGWEIVVLTRQPRPEAVFREVHWDAQHLGPWEVECEGATAVINLTGRSINCLPTPENRREILESRVHSVNALGQAFRRAKQPPPLWVQVSATGYYGDAGEQWCDENTSAGTDFLAKVCARWEQAFHGQILPAGVRRVVLRLGTVLDATHGALPPLRRITRLFLGGAAGSGQQYLSWIHREDVLNGFRQAIRQAAMEGTYNLTAPTPVKNVDFMRRLRAALHRPWSPAAPAAAVRFVAKHLLRTDPALILQGQRARSDRVQAAGLAFAFGDLDAALADLLR